jgi:hypothetical protein
MGTFGLNNFLIDSYWANRVGLHRQRFSNGLKLVLVKNQELKV